MFEANVWSVYFIWFTCYVDIDLKLRGQCRFMISEALECYWKLPNKYMGLFIYWVLGSQHMICCLFAIYHTLTEIYVSSQLMNGFTIFISYPVMVTWPVFVRVIKFMYLSPWCYEIMILMSQFVKMLFDTLSTICKICIIKATVMRLF